MANEESNSFLRDLKEFIAMEAAQLVNAKGQEQSHQIGKKFLIVAGFGWSGSSAIIDLLSDYSKVYVPDVEFCLIKDPFGLVDLRYELVENWDQIRSAAAVNNFLWLCKKCNRAQHSRFSPPGLDYCRVLNRNFLQMSRDYLGSISDFEFSGINFYENFKKKYIVFLIGRVLKSLSRRVNREFPVDIYCKKLAFAAPTAERFDKASKEYIKKLFLEIESNIIVLDQAISPKDAVSLSRFFDDAKMIIVDRDPRDIYIDMIEQESLIGSELKKSHDAQKYVLWHKQLRGGAVPSDRVLKISFEDLVTSPEKIRKEISTFLNWDLGDYNPDSFDPEVSKKNIGLWKKSKYLDRKDEIDLIYSALIDPEGHI